MAEGAAQIARFQKLTKCHARLVDALLAHGKAKKTKTKTPKAKAGKKKHPNGGKVKKPKALKAAKPATA